MGRRLLAFCLVLPAALALAGEPADDATAPCTPEWFSTQLATQFPDPPAPAHYDFMPGRDLPDSTLAARIRQGQFSVVFEVIGSGMADAAAVPVNIGLRGSDTVLEPLLRSLDTQLQGKHLEHLTVVVAGPEDMQEPYASFVGALGARLVFLPVHVERCDPGVKVRKPRPAKPVVAAKAAAPARASQESKPHPGSPARKAAKPAKPAKPAGKGSAKAAATGKKSGSSSPAATSPAR